MLNHILFKKNFILINSLTGLVTFFSFLIGFYGISIQVGYLMPNSLYTYISNIYI